MPNNLRIALCAAALVALHIFTKVTQHGEHVVAGADLAKVIATADDPKAAELATIAQAHPLTVITFFETWCGPCKIELPHLEKLYESHQDDGLAIIGIYGPSSDEDLSSFSSRLGLTFPLMRDARGLIGHAFGVEAVPTTVVVDRQLQVVHTSLGYQSGLTNDIEHMLEKEKGKGTAP